MNWSWLRDANAATGLKGWSIPPFWAVTCGVWAICTLYVVFTWRDGQRADDRLPILWMGAWTGILTVYSGVQRLEQRDHRETDYEAMRIKAGAPAPTVVAGSVGQANVEVGQ